MDDRTDDSSDVPGSGESGRQDTSERSPEPDRESADSPAATAPADPAAARFRSLLREQRVWDTGDAGQLPGSTLDPGRTPEGPLPLFHRWFADAVDAGQAEPHTMTLATVDADGRPDARVVMLHDADARGWHFATHSTSVKGSQLAACPYAALSFYWNLPARAVRVRGRIVPAYAAETSADLHARSTGALAAALAGRQSEVLESRDDLGRAYEAAWQRARRDPAAEAPTWTGYVVAADEVEFFQGDAHRQHARLRYRRTAPDADSWVKELLWP